MGSTVKYSPWQFAQKNPALARAPIPHQLMGDAGLEGRVRKFCGVIAGRESAAQEETEENCWHHKDSYGAPLNLMKPEIQSW